MNTPENLTIECKWKELVKVVLPTLKEDSVEYKERRKMFYSGFICGIDTVTEVANTFSDNEAGYIINNYVKEYTNAIPFTLAVTEPLKPSPDLSGSSPDNPVKQN